MDKNDILRKLTSRKFWVALVGFITALLTAFHVSDGSIAQVSAIIMAFGSLMIYVLAEGATDCASLKEGDSTEIGSTYNIKSGTTTTTTKEEKK